MSFFLLAIIMDNSYISRKFIIRINSNVTTAEGDGNPNKAHKTNIVCDNDYPNKAKKAITVICNFTDGTLVCDDGKR